MGPAFDPQGAPGGRGSETMKFGFPTHPGDPGPCTIQISKTRPGTVGLGHPVYE